MWYRRAPSNGNGAGLGLDFGSSQGVTTSQLARRSTLNVVSRSRRHLRGWDSPVRQTEVTEAARRSLLGCRSSLPASPDVRASSSLCLVSVRVSFAVSGCSCEFPPYIIIHAPLRNVCLPNKPWTID